MLTRRRSFLRMLSEYEAEAGFRVLPKTAQVPKVTSHSSEFNASPSDIVPSPEIQSKLPGLSSKFRHSFAPFRILTWVLGGLLVRLSGHLSFGGLPGILIIFIA